MLFVSVTVAGFWVQCMDKKPQLAIQAVCNMMLKSCLPAVDPFETLSARVVPAGSKTTLYLNLQERYTFVEVCAGAACLSQCMLYADHRVARLDLDYWADFVESRRQAGRHLHCSNPLDISEPSGMAFLG